MAKRSPIILSFTVQSRKPRPQQPCDQGNTKIVKKLCGTGDEVAHALIHFFALVQISLLDRFCVMFKECNLS